MPIAECVHRASAADLRLFLTESGRRLCTIVNRLSCASGASFCELDPKGALLD
jgi:hypothetical protein